MKLHIIQPALPKYRKPLFDKLSEKFNLKVYASKKDFLGVNSIKNTNYATILGDFVNIFNLFFWQKGLSLYKAYDKGDCVVINGNPRILNYMLLLAFLRVRGIETIWWGHGWSAGSHGLSSRIRLMISRVATKRLFYNDAELTKINIPNSYSLNNGLCSSEINFNKIERNFQLGKFENTLNLIFIGRLTNKSNMELLLKALSLCPSGINLTVIGDGQLRSEYERIVSSLKLTSRVNFIGALYSESDIGKHMIKSHVFIYPGAVGLSLIHAFNYGVPCIIHSNRDNHMPENFAFKENFNGLSFDMGCEISLSKAIIKFFKMDNKCYKLMSENARNTVLKDYNLESMFQRFYQAILS